MITTKQFKQAKNGTVFGWYDWTDGVLKGLDVKLSNNKVIVVESFNPLSFPEIDFRFNPTLKELSHYKIMPKKIQEMFR